MRYAYYTIIQIKIPFQDDVSFEDKKRKGRATDLMIQHDMKLVVNLDGNN